MTSVLILAPQSDMHANAVQWGLLKSGHHVLRMSENDVSQKQSISLTFKDGHSRTEFFMGDLKIDLARYDVVWRCGEDTQAIGAMTQAWQDISSMSRATWINDRAAALRANNRPYQLAMAAAAGFQLPDTLVSNRPQDIRAFAKEHKGRITYGPLAPTNILPISDSARVTPDRLSDMKALSSTPRLYQRMAEKAYVVRVNIFGSHIVAIRCESDKTLSLYSLPMPLEDSALKLMKALDLSFGTIDIAVTPDGDYLFLELNQMGQFLWIDDLLPEAQLLTRMVKFIGNGGKILDGERFEQSDITFQNFMQI